MLHTMHPRLYSCCPYMLNSRTRLYAWNPVRRCPDVPSSGVGKRSVRGASAGPIKHGSLTVDTVDRDGNIAIPIDLLQILPKVSKFLRGDFELGMTSQAEQAELHRKAVEQAKQWLESLQLDDTDIGKKEFLKWQQQHEHSCSDGSLKPRWLSICTDTTAHSGARIRQNSPNSPFPSQIASDTAHSTHTTPTEDGVNSAAQHGTSPLLQKQNSTFPVPLGPLGAPSNDFSKPSVPRESGLVCMYGPWPMLEGMALKDAGASFTVDVSSLTFSNCDIAQGSWRSFLVLLSADASFFENENLWPNFMQHQGRTLYNISCKHAVEFLADPCVSQINKHVRNMAKHGEGNQLEYLVQRWGITTLTELCQIHDKLSLNPSAAATCAHAHGRQHENMFLHRD